MRILITGANGRLARTVMASLRDTAYVVAMDTRFSVPLPKGVEVQEGDLRDPELLATALSGVEAVLHLAPLTTIFEDKQDVLDEAAHGTYVLMTSALAAGVRRLIIGSTLQLFDRLPAHWDVSESWRPRPEPRVEHLRAWLAELSAREVTRASQARVVCLRFGRPVGNAEAASLPYDPLWLHEEDAVRGVQRALAFEPLGWSVFHITAAGPRSKVRLAAAGTEAFSYPSTKPLGYQPAHDFRQRWEAGGLQKSDTGEQALQEVFGPRDPVPSRPIENVVVFGAGGPLGAAATTELLPSYRLLLTDIRPLAEIAAEEPRKDQRHGAPVPVAPSGPHECRTVDVTNFEEVMAACEDMDAIINCTVARANPGEAFRVNTLGAYNIACAAAERGIRRVVHTGPQLVALHGEGDYLPDYDVPDEAPPRPGRNLYGHSKYLGQEILRVFAEYYGLEVPVLLFNDFTQPETGQPRPLHPFTVSWQDAARAIRRALEVEALPQPVEMLHVCADLPHGKYINRRAKEVLEWQPQDDLNHLWSMPG